MLPPTQDGCHVAVAHDGPHVMVTRLQSGSQFAPARKMAFDYESCKGIMLKALVPSHLDRGVKGIENQVHVQNFMTAKKPI